MPFPWIWPFRHPKPDVDAGPKVDAASIVRKARRLRFRVRRGAVADLAGAYVGARPGTGLAFAELRPYEPGDDVRHMDWNVTARQGRPYVRRFAEERALTVWLIVNISASLRFGPEGRTKADRAVQSAALLATAAIQAGDRAGLALVSDQVEAELPPGSGPRHLARLVRALVATPSRSKRTALEVGLRGLSRSRRRALVVVLSDFLTIESVPTWKTVARRHDVVALRLVEPREERLPRSGLVDLVDAELGMTRTVDLGSRRIRDRYARSAEVRTQEFRRWCASAGVSGLDLSTADDPTGSPDPILRRPGQASRRAVSDVAGESTRVEVLVPPRPNLGPEPWPEQPGGLTGLGWWGVGFAILLTVIADGDGSEAGRGSGTPSPRDRPRSFPNPIRRPVSA